ncbi:MAG: hypothetical protein BWY09_02424 [Candidatus Hydrogenedentes bacterium ADurb.Bin179]|nr:MAG: hypothetical protein BWY09_02424 [Candidatus Hydrogenedentes bacterium ADurb.Bin179]
MTPAAAMSSVRDNDGFDIREDRFDYAGCDGVSRSSIRRRTSAEQTR